ncbi:CHAT domain-containing protein [Mycobacterium sp. MBM]|nr:CHAT domain-containing protein [Mycobacterium sp. MBM]
MNIVNVLVREDPARIYDVGAPLPVLVEISSEKWGSHAFAAILPVLTYHDLDSLEDAASVEITGADELERYDRSCDQLLAVGRTLFDSTLGGWPQWPQLRTDARNSPDPTRIWFESDSALLAAQPWELVAAPDDGFLALLPWAHILRNPQAAASAATLEVRPPLRILLCGPTPRTLPEIDVAFEFMRLSHVLNGFGGAIEVHSVTDASTPCTFARLKEVIVRGGPWHVVHFSGHGGYEPSIGGYLAFAHPDGSPDLRPADSVMALLANHGALRLIVLNACRGAMSANRQVVDAVAGRLVQAGVPACVSMQFEITDRAAIPFASALYSGLLQHGDVEQAVSDGRSAINEVTLLPGNPVGGLARCLEWATPVLHLNTVEARLFTVASTNTTDSGRGASRVDIKGSLDNPARHAWRLCYFTSLTPEQSIERIETAIRSTTDVRKIEHRQDGLTALIGGFKIFGVADATQKCEVIAYDSNQGTAVQIVCSFIRWSLVENGLNKDIAMRLAAYLGINYR